MTWLRNLHLSYSQVEKIPDRAATLVRGLKVLTGLQQLHLTVSLCAEGVAALARAVQGMARLQLLDFKHVQVEPRNGDPLVHALHGKTGLRELNFSAMQLSGSQAGASLALALQGMTAMQRLDISGNRVGNQAGAALALALALRGMTGLRLLNLSSNEMGSVAGAALGQALKGMTRLQQLKLSANHQGLDGVAALSAALRGMTALQWLDLSSNFLVVRSGSDLDLALQSLTGLQRLTLCCCHLVDQDAAPLSIALKGMAELQQLDLSGNYLFSGAALVDALLHMAALCIIWISPTLALAQRVLLPVPGHSLG